MTLVGMEQRWWWWWCGVTQSESFPGSGLEDSYKLYAVICWFKINPDHVCKVTGRCWKVNANICVLKKVSLVGRDLANYPVVCSRWAGICSQCKMIYMCIIEVISQCLGDLRASAGRQCCQEGDCVLPRAVQSRTALITLKRAALPTHHLNMLLPAGKHSGPSLLVTAAAGLVSEPAALGCTKPHACNFHCMSSCNLRAKVARVSMVWRLTVGNLTAPPIAHLAPSFCPPCLEFFSSRFWSFSMFILLWHFASHE